MSMRGRLVDLGAAGVAAAQLVAAAVLVPHGGELRLPDDTALGGACWIRGTFGFDCPFCGLTRSFVALAHGDLGAALRWHPAGPILFAAMMVFVLAVSITALARWQPIVERQRFLVAFEGIALLCLVVGVVKMVRS